MARDQDKRILDDGEKLTVPMRFADGSTGRVAITDAAGNSDLHTFSRPGFRVANNAFARGELKAAYAAYERDLGDAYKAPADIPPTGFGSASASEMRGDKEGDVCTINGRPGHLNAKLECIPDEGEDDDDDDDYGDEATDARRDEVREALMARGHAADHVGRYLASLDADTVLQNGCASHVRHFEKLINDGRSRRSFTFADAERQRASRTKEAYAAYDADLKNAWRGDK
jgi:hypothetical protein